VNRELELPAGARTGGGRLCTEFFLQWLCLHA